MTGVYLHIPYCRQACHYCDFHFSTVLRTKDQMVNAMVFEIEQRIPEIGIVHSIYFGGGTPSILEPSEIARLLNAIYKKSSVASNAEITLEANPDDLTPERLSAWKSMGINRLSIGVQSFHNHDLRWMNRAHNAEEALSALDKARHAGFETLTIDLIYGLPTWQHNEWEENLAQLFDLKPTHFSAYILTIEEKTVLGKMARKNKLAPVEDETIAVQYAQLTNAASNAGYEHYEVSNFALPHHRAAHNSAYWAGTPYVGIGPGAHSFRENTRRWNLSSNPAYLKALLSGSRYWEEEELSTTDHYNEHLMTSLRTSRGLSLSETSALYGMRPDTLEPQEWTRLIHEGLLIEVEGRFIVPEHHWLWADRIASDLFAV